MNMSRTLAKISIYLLQSEGNKTVLNLFKNTSWTFIQVLKISSIVLENVAANFPQNMFMYEIMQSLNREI